MAEEFYHSKGFSPDHTRSSYQRRPFKDDLTIKAFEAKADVHWKEEREEADEKAVKRAQADRHNEKRRLKRAARARVATEGARDGGGEEGAERSVRAAAA